MASSEYSEHNLQSGLEARHSPLRPRTPVLLVAPSPVALPPVQPVPSAAEYGPSNRSVQRQVAAPVFQAAATLQRWAAEGGQQQVTLQRQIAEVRAGLPEGAEGAAAQRQATRAQPPTLPAAFQRHPSGQPPSHKPSLSDYGQVYAYEMSRQQPDSQGMYASGPALQVQRQVATGLAHTVRTSSLPPVQRYAELGRTLARIQRQPLGLATVRGSLGLMPAGERPAIQRALDEANAALQRQEAQDGQVAELHALQRQLAEQQAQQDVHHVARRVRERQGGGEPLPAAVQRHLEQGLNADMSRVRVHTDAEADQLALGLGAKAFTSGNDIYFRRGAYDPNTQSGLELLAHEGEHHKQQVHQGRVGPGVDPDAGLEQEARQAGARVAARLPDPGKSDVSQATPPVKSDLNADWKPPQFRPSPHAPGVYTPQAALQRAQDGAVQRAALNPLYSLYPGLQRAEDLSMQRQWLGDAWNATGGKVVSAGADAIKGQLSSFVSGLPGYKPLCMAFGKDLVTGKAMDQNPNAILDALASFVPGPMKDMIARLRETGAIPKAWAWFKGELAKLNLGGTLGDVLGALKSLDLGKAKNAITSRISGLTKLVVASARKLAEIVLDTVAAGLGPAAQQVIAGLKKSGDVIMGVIKNPGTFAKNMIAAVGGGFKSFSSNAPRHLAQGVGQWLTGTSGISFPDKLDFQGVFMTVLSVLGLTYQNFRGKLARTLGKGGDEKLAKAEKTVDVVRNLASKGLHGAEELKGSQAEVGNQVKTEVIGEIRNNVIQAAVLKLVSMFVPGGGFVTALISAFDTVKFLIDKGRDLASLAMSVIGSVGAIAAGNIGAAVSGVERSLAASIPLALGFLGRLLHIGNIGSKVKGIIVKLKGKMDAVVNKVMQRVAGVINKVMGKDDKTKPGDKRSKPGEAPADVAKRNKEMPKAEKQKKLDKAVPAIQAQLKPLLDKGVKESVLQAKLSSLKRQFDLTDLKLIKQGGSFDIIAEVNPKKNVLKGFTPTERAILKVANEVGSEIMADPRVKVAAQRIAQQRAAGKGTTSGNPLQVRPGDGYGAAADLREDASRRLPGQQTHYEVNGQQVKHTQSRRNANQTPGTLEVQVKGGGSYPAIQQTLEKMKQDLMQEDPNLTAARAEREVAELIRGNLRGTSKRPISPAQKEHLAQVTHLLFSVEPGRNNSAASFSSMMLDSISAGSLSLKDAFTGRGDGRGLYPPSQVGAVGAMNRIEAETRRDNGSIDGEGQSVNKILVEQRDRQLEFCKRWISQRMQSLDMDFDDEDSFAQYVNAHYKKELLESVVKNMH